MHADLESAYGCDGKDTACAVYAASDLDALLASNGNPPTDDFGHGTHVASLAAGNGLSSKVPTYIGMAPEATFVVARVAQANGDIDDADVLRAVKFVFDRAADLGMPAVVNLSLGSDFGAHDGSSALEGELSGMVGPDFPGRAIVVAAGNSAGPVCGAGLAVSRALRGAHRSSRAARLGVDRAAAHARADRQRSGERHRLRLDRLS